MSETEPELGLGFVKAVDAMAVDVEFPAVGRLRRYNRRTAPLRRLEFRTGDTVRGRAGETFEVNKVEVRLGLNWYLGKKKAEQLCESGLSAEYRLQRPLERFLAGQVDPIGAYQLRRRTLEFRHRTLKSPVRGMLGPRAMLLPHQVYVVSQVTGRGVPRALLADEVGLGKTIEAGWILHQLMVTERVRRVLVLVPQALENQWFVELLRRFNLPFWVPDSQSDDAMESEDLADRERFILAIESLEDPEFAESILQIEWDMVIVDEAHRIDWEPGEPSPEYEILEQLSNKTHGLLLLTATPEQLGLEGHFGRLRLVDPQRFSSWEDYQTEHKRYIQIVNLAEALWSNKEVDAKTKKALAELLEDKVDKSVLDNLSDAQRRREVLLALVDHYGTGRIYLRNARRVVQLEDFSFPKRMLHEHRLALAGKDAGGKKAGEAKEDALVAWMGAFVKKHPQDKILLICSSARAVTRLKERLQNEHAVRAVDFHEEQPLLVRDRNAAYFEDPDGARILLSSEIGGEGRNFQHAKHLILADLPIEPDVLEQRIGRLDRIGQANDIQIHVPYLPGSREEVLLQWYQGVFKAFSAPPSGAGLVHDGLFEELEPFLVKPQLALGEKKKNFDALLEQAKSAYGKAQKVIEAGRDRLIELNSFNAEAGTQLAKSISESERPEELKAYLESIFDGMGIHVEHLDKESLFVEPGDSMFSSYFPALPPEGIRMSFSRAKALKRDDLTLMTWDHPIVTETMLAIASQEFGNVSVAGWHGIMKPKGLPPVMLEVFFVLECVADSAWFADEFLPTEPVRILLDVRQREDISAQWPVEKIHSHLTGLTIEQIQAVRQIPVAALKELLAKATAIGEARRKKRLEEVTKKMEDTVETEIRRLKALQSKNGLVSEQEVDWWEARRRCLRDALKNAQLRLDSFIIIVAH